jgi:hypothetical protein
VESSLCEKPERHATRRLSDHLVLEGQKQKVHSLVDKVYSRENLKLAWERVRANRGASGADRVLITASYKSPPNQIGVTRERNLAHSSVCCCRVSQASMVAR